MADTPEEIERAILHETSLPFIAVSRAIYVDDHEAMMNWMLENVTGEIVQHYRSGVIWCRGLEAIVHGGRMLRVTYQFFTKGKSRFAYSFEDDLDCLKFKLAWG
jgi:hypothetical protein